MCAYIDYIAAVTQFKFGMQRTKHWFKDPVHAEKRVQVGGMKARGAGCALDRARPGETSRMDGAM
jgi:hypothetical protein